MTLVPVTALHRPSQFQSSAAFLLVSSQHLPTTHDAHSANPDHLDTATTASNRSFVICIPYISSWPSLLWTQALSTLINEHRIGTGNYAKQSAMASSRNSWYGEVMIRRIGRSVAETQTREPAHKWGRVFRNSLFAAEVLTVAMCFPHKK